jgi:hypothetical protein
MDGIASLASANNRRFEIGSIAGSAQPYERQTELGTAGRGGA